ncbi:hypothetical protein ACAW74_08770 [Fibrella sp. WM1]|uniref:hypothetical protein n=1 Tax=Fibrella musci TaxID=3242485 RepID=UPI0035221323
MKSTILILLLVVGVLGCSRKGQPDVAPQPVAQFTIGSTQYDLLNRESANESCNSIFFSFNMYRKSAEFAVKDFPYSVEFHLSKSGQLLYARLDGDTGEYRTSTFAPMRSASISNFVYNTTENELSLNLEVTMLNTRTLQPLTLKAVVDRLFISQTDCANRNFNTFSASLERIGRQTSFFQQRFNTGETNNLYQPPYPTPTYYRHTLISTDGYEVQLENGVGLKPLKKGVYDVSSEAVTPLKVLFSEFLGETDPASLDSYLRKDWRAYRVSGTLEIVDEYASGNRVSGKLTFTAFDTDGKPVFRLTNGVFVVYNPLR